MSKTTLTSLLAVSFSLSLAFALGGCAAPQGTESTDTKEATSNSSAALEVFCHPSIKADGTLETACDPALIGGSDGSGAGGGADNGGPNAPGGTPSWHACDDACTDVYDDCAARCTTVSCRAVCSRNFRGCDLRCH